MSIHREGAKDYTTNGRKSLNYIQTKHDHGSINIISPRTTTTTTTATTNPTAPQTTKHAQITPLQTRLNDNGRDHKVERPSMPEICNPKNKMFSAKKPLFKLVL
ncbi:hypothetical protein CHS0354_037904, partial [Potamilus streckersoni]